MAGLGWAGTLGGLALCVLIFLSAFLAFDDSRPAVRLRQDGVLHLPSVPDAEVPAVPLARPSQPTPAPAPAGSGQPAPPTLGDTTREVVGVVGAEVGQVSPPAGQVIGRTGDTLGDAVDALTRPGR